MAKRKHEAAHQVRKVANPSPKKEDYAEVDKKDNKKFFMTLAGITLLLLILLYFIYNSVS